MATFSTSRLHCEPFHLWAKRLQRRLEKLSGQEQIYPRSLVLTRRFVEQIKQLEQQYNALRFVEVQTAYRGWLRAYRMTIPHSLITEDWTVLHREIRPELQRVLHLVAQEYGQFSFQVIQQSEFVRPSESQDQHHQQYFQNKMQNVLNASEVEHVITMQLQNIARRIEEFLRNGSRWQHKRVLTLEINVAKYRALRGSSYVPLPKYLADKKAIVNVQNEDNQCFKWAVLSALYPATKDPQRVSKYKEYENKLNFEGIKFPVQLAAISQFEKQNGLAVFIYHLADDNKSIQPLRMSKMRVSYEQRVRLFYHKKHYMWIKNLSRLLYDQTRHEHKKHFCDYCCSSFNSEVNRNVHEERCCQFDHAQLVQMPSEDKRELKFKNYAKKLLVPFIIYADFESLNLLNDGTLPGPSDKTEYLTHHEPSSFTYIIIRSDGAIFKHRLYRGEEAAAKFIDWLKDDVDDVYAALKQIEPMRMSAEEERVFQNTAMCHICERTFDYSKATDGRLVKVHDHDHITGEFRGAAHYHCNLNYRFSPRIPIFFHNLRGYDSHLIIQGAERGDEIEVIANNLEKYMSFTLKKRLVFKDSFQFLLAGLDKLVKTLNREDFHLVSQFFSGERLELMMQKQLCPYEYLDSWERFNETKPPKRETFNDNLKGEAINDEDYAHFLNVWLKFNIQTLGDYVDLYLWLDVLLLADVFENFRRNAMEIYKLDPTHYITYPHLAFDALLYTCCDQPSLQLLTDPDMHILFEQGMRGSISVASHRYAKANPQYKYQRVEGWQRVDNPDFDPSKPSSYIVYLDANNLYGWSMKQPLPMDSFRWWDEEELASLNGNAMAARNTVLTWSKDGPKGWTLDVELLSTTAARCAR